MNRSCIPSSAFTSKQDEQKCRATMHINRKPGEQVEVDWAGNSAHIIDPDTGEIIDVFLFVEVMTLHQEFPMLHHSQNHFR